MPEDLTPSHRDHASEHRETDISEDSALLSATVNPLIQTNYGVNYSVDVTAPSTSNSSQSPPVAVTPLPWRLMIILWSLMGAQALAFEQIFPFVNQMILEIGVVNDPKQVGYYSGMIESTFAFMSFLAVMPCSYISDRIGRKPVVLAGLSGMAISVALFGLSKSFLAMAISRCFGGLLGGSFMAIKVIVAESTDRSNQGAAMSGITMGYRIGQVFGQPLGGYLAHPERHWSFFSTGFWKEYPFALPGFVASAATAVFITLGIFWIDETLPSKRKNRNFQNEYGAISNSDENRCTDTAEVEHNAASETQSSASLTDRPPTKTVLSPSIIILLVSNCMMVYLSEVTFSIYPLFAFTPIDYGGLGLSEADIGTHLAIRAFICIALLFLYDPLYRKFGTVRVYQMSIITWPISILFYPLLNVLARNGYIGSLLYHGVLLGFFLIWGVGGFAWIGGNVLLNDMAPSADDISTLNGIFQMFIALPQALAPASATYMFALSIKSSLAGGNMIWILLFILGCFTFFQTLMLKEPTHDWRQDLKNSIND